MTPTTLYDESAPLVAWRYYVVTETPDGLRLGGLGARPVPLADDGFTLTAECPYGGEPVQGGCRYEGSSTICGCGIYGHLQAAHVIRRGRGRTNAIRAFGPTAFFGHLQVNGHTVRAQYARPLELEVRAPGLSRAGTAETAAEALSATYGIPVHTALSGDPFDPSKFTTVEP